MIFIIDTNRIIAALIKNSISREIILNGSFSLIGVEFSRNEIQDHKEEILKKAKISEEEFEYILHKLCRRISFLDNSIIEKYMSEAKTIMDTIDADDTPFIAAALGIGADIWSDDKHFEKQSRVKVWKTSELYQIFTDEGRG